MCLDRILSLEFVIEVARIDVRTWTSMCPFCESTVLTYCKYHTERTWKYIAGISVRFWACMSHTHAHTRSKRAKERERKGDYWMEHKCGVDRNRFSALWILNMHNTNTHSHWHKPKWKRKGEWLSTAVALEKMERQMKMFAKYTGVIDEVTHIHICTHTLPECISRQEQQ